MTHSSMPFFDRISYKFYLTFDVLEFFSPETYMMY